MSCPAGPVCVTAPPVQAQERGQQLARPHTSPCPGGAQVGVSPVSPSRSPTDGQHLLLTLPSVKHALDGEDFRLPIKEQQGGTRGWVRQAGGSPCPCQPLPALWMRTGPDVWLPAASLSARRSRWHLVHSAEQPAQDVRAKGQFTVFSLQDTQHAERLGPLGYSHVTHEDAEAQRGQAISPRTHS